MIREYIRKVLLEMTFRPLISDPPDELHRVKELEQIKQMRQADQTPEDLARKLDTGITDLFNNVLLSHGHGDNLEKIEKLKHSIKEIVYQHKDYYDSLRPNELADKFGISFDFDFLSSAQTPSYPSGHTTQAYWIAMNLSDEFPDTREDMMTVAKSIERSRINRGVHFPSDNEGGRELAVKLYRAMKR